MSIPGLEIGDNFITQEEHDKLIKFILTQKFETVSGRRVQQYGFAYNYESSTTKPEYIGAIPEEFGFLLDRLCGCENTKGTNESEDGSNTDVGESKSNTSTSESKRNSSRSNTNPQGIFDRKPEQIIINEYEPGQGIYPHVDQRNHFGKVVVSISLGSQCIMDFVNLETKEAHQALLLPRSICVLTGDARYKYTHGIARRKNDEINGVKVPRGTRYSITFRTMNVLD